LHLVLEILQRQTHQLSVVITKEHQLSMNVGGGYGGTTNSSHTLKQRNAILRSVVGPALHGAMDASSSLRGSPRAHLCWSGGLLGASASIHGSSVRAAGNAAALIQWMSVADQIRKNGPNGGINEMDQIWTDLSMVLERNAFVVPYAPTVTLADLDLCVALLLQAKESVSDDVSNTVPRSVRRWMKQVVAVLLALGQDVGMVIEQRLVIPSWLSPSSCTALSQVPILFTGTENANDVLSALYKQSKSTAPKVGPPVSKAVTSTAETAAPTEKKTKLTKQDKAAAKKADAASKPATATAAKPAPVVAEAPLDIMALDIRVGKIIKAWPHETADKLYCEEIDLGNGEVRNIASGLRPFYKVEDLQDRIVLVLCNLKKRTLVGFPSHGMVLCASNVDHSAVEFVVPPPNTPLGERVVFDGLDPTAPPEPDTKVAKKKMFESLAPDLRTNDTGAVVWKSHVATTSAGTVVALNGMANASVS
jgi:aminoacyl tRNA synthase complex-interacting multifunctional protein 1